MKTILRRLFILLFGDPDPLPHKPGLLPYHPLYFSAIQQDALIKMRKDLWACAVCDTNNGKNGLTKVRFAELIHEYLTPVMIDALTKKFIDDYTGSNLWIVCEYMEMSFYQLMHTGECKTQHIYNSCREIRMKYNNVELGRLYQN